MSASRILVAASLFFFNATEFLLSTGGEMMQGGGPVTLTAIVDEPARPPGSVTV